MTYRELYQTGKKELEKAELESPAFDALCLFQKSTGLDRKELAIHGNEQADPEKARQFLEWIRLRGSHVPLQYLLGSWGFLDMELDVGEGVLIPREETELLVETAAAFLKEREKIHWAPLKAVDLCAGTGAVALGLAGKVPELEMYALELYPKAFSYLERNIQKTGRKVHAVQGDILRQEVAENYFELDAVVSNPPYIPSGEIPALQEEVLLEPSTALDGGGDGLRFYREISKLWIPRLASGGLCCVEIGEDQGKLVGDLFAEAGLREIEVLQDFNGLDRVVKGIYP